jgi:hypothetical protein
VILIGVGQMRNQHPLDSITISTLAAGHRRAITGFGSEQIVTYMTNESGNRRHWATISRTQSSALMTSGPGASSPTTVLADNVVALHIRYFNGNDWLESWDSNKLPRGQQLPVAVGIDLQLGARNGHVMNFSTEVMIPMAVAAW